MAKALELAAIQHGDRVLHREAHLLLEELTDPTLDGTRKALLTGLSPVPLMIIDDQGMRKLPPTTTEDLLELIMRRYERASTILTSNRPVEDWAKLRGGLGQAARQPPPAPCLRDHLWPAELADQTPPDA
jgi:DNA replication protein DnaC